MAVSRLSVSMLVASLILLLYWQTSSASSPEFLESFLDRDNSPKTELPFRTREKVAASLVTVKDSLSLIKDVVGKIDTNRVSSIMKGLASVASWAPGIGGLVSSFINVALAFLPQENPLKELREGFAEVNRKLDSLSIQISNLATDVEWFNYASVYSQDEIRILNAWNKFNEFRENSEKLHSEEEKLRLAEIFTSYYENTGTEASVANLYHYLTVSSTSLSGNLNDLLRKKFKCGISEIGKYNVYFSSLLWRGMVLNQFYWKLMGFNFLDKTAEHTQMFKTVYTAQKAAVNFCLDSYEQYVKDDVVEISKSLSPDNKLAIADQVKNALDKKYYWLNWVVLVYNSNQEDYYILYDMFKAYVDVKITVAVGFTLKADIIEIDRPHITKAADRCFSDQSCEINVEAPKCTYIFELGTTDYTHFIYQLHLKATHAAYGSDFAEVPQPFHKNDCWWGSYKRQISSYYSRLSPDCTCTNNGRCDQRLLHWNEVMCECPDGFYGQHCEHRMQITQHATTTTNAHVPDITTLEAKLKAMESKLEDILNTVKGGCRPHLTFSK